MHRAIANYATTGADSDEELLRKYGALIDRSARRIVMRTGLHSAHDDMWSAGALGLIEAARRFDGARKCWVVGRGSEAALATFLAEYAVIATLDVDAWIATHAPTPPPARRDNVRIDGNQIIVDAPYSPDATDAMRQVRGRRWLADRRVNSFPLSAAAEVAALARRFGWTGAEVADRIAAPAPAAPAAPQAAPRPAPAAEAPADLHEPPAGTWAATARAMARLFPDFDWDTWKDMHKEADCTA
jgi:hypothetical protein